MNKIFLTLVTSFLLSNIYAQDISLKIKSISKTYKSDFKGRDSNLNGNYITGEFELINNTNDTLVLPSISKNRNWSNSFQNEFYIQGFDKPYLTFEVEMIMNKSNEKSEVISAVSEIEIVSTEVEPNYDYEKPNKLTGSYSITKIAPNREKTFYFVKKATYSEVKVKVLCNTVFLNNQKLRKKLKKELKMEIVNQKKEIKSLENKLKKLEEIISKYSTIIKNGSTTSYKINVERDTKEYNDFQNALNEKSKTKSNLRSKKITPKIEYLKNLMSITPIKLVSETYQKKLQ